MWECSQPGRPRPEPAFLLTVPDERTGTWQSFSSTIAVEEAPLECPDVSAGACNDLLSESRRGPSNFSEWTDVDTIAVISGTGARGEDVFPGTEGAKEDGFEVNEDMKLVG